MTLGQGGSAIAASLQPGGRLGRYQLARELGRGGMGVVFEARDLTLGRVVAIKVLKPESIGVHEAVRRFIREGKAVAALTHPNIVSVYDVGEESGCPFLVMEHLVGETLSRKLRGAANRRLPMSSVLDTFIPVFDAIATAHDAGIVHRDLKPDNIFLADRRGRIDPVVLDFGIAKALDGAGEGSETATGQVFGTLRYMSPEQLQGANKQMGPSADQFALGVILYEALAGRHPLGADIEQLGPLAVLNRASFARPDPLVTVAPLVGGSLSLIVERMMAKASQNRFPSLRAAAEALTAAVKNPAAGLEGADGLAAVHAATLLNAPPAAGQVDGLAPTIAVAGAPHRPERKRSASRPLVAIMIALPLLGAGALLIGRLSRSVPPAGQTANQVAAPERTGQPAPVARIPGPPKDTQAASVARIPDLPTEREGPPPVMAPAVVLTVASPPTQRTPHARKRASHPQLGAAPPKAADGLPAAPTSAPPAAVSPSRNETAPSPPFPGKEPRPRQRPNGAPDIR